jgi:hypothetical protein
MKEARGSPADNMNSASHQVALTGITPIAGDFWAPITRTKPLFSIIGLAAALSLSGCEALKYHRREMKGEMIQNEKVVGACRLTFNADWEGRIGQWSVSVRELDEPFSHTFRSRSDEFYQDFKIRIIGIDGKVKGVYSTPVKGDIALDVPGAVSYKSDKPYNVIIPKFEGESIAEIGRLGIVEVKINLP